MDEPQQKVLNRQKFKDVEYHNCLTTKLADS